MSHVPVTKLTSLNTQYHCSAATAADIVQLYWAKGQSRQQIATKVNRLLQEDSNVVQSMSDYEL